MTLPTSPREGTRTPARVPKTGPRVAPVPVQDASRNDRALPYTSGEDALTEPEIHAVLGAAADFEAEVLLRLAISTGIRREDLVRVRMEGVDLEAARVRYRESKKRRQWEAQVGGEMLSALRKWVHALPSGSEWLFPSSHGPKGRKSGHRSGRWAYNVFQAALDGANLDRRPFHALRATCVKLCQRRGWTPEQVSRLTGDRISTIQRHYATPSRDEMGQVAREKPLL